MGTKGLIKHILEYTVRSGYEDFLVFVMLMYLWNPFPTKCAVHPYMLEVGKQAHKILSKVEGRGIRITRC